MNTERQRSNPHSPSQHISSAGSFVPRKYQAIQFCCHLLFFFQQQWRRRIGLLSPLLGRIRLFSLLPLGTKMAFIPLENHPQGICRQNLAGKPLPTKEQQQNWVLRISVWITDQSELCNDSFDQVYTVGIGAM